MYIADLHIHSRYSRATSKDGTPEQLELWARRKGIALVGTGDFTHPAWRQELREKLTPAEDGLYVLKDEYRIADGTRADSFRPRFVVTGEISSIYKKDGKVRKVHSLLLLPGLEDGERLSRKLEAIGNIHSDGRPILGLDCHDLLEILLEVSPEGMYVPAHIWTPHFSMFGAFSGFRSIQECFGDLAGHIHAVETGLSSDPPMNWRVEGLDGLQLLSNSDAHSPSKLGREANLLDGELSYPGLYRAVQEGDGLRGTIEFFPEEGKYHYDGHRKCGVCLSPQEAARLGGICPVCGKKLTVGVSHRVEELSDRPEGYVQPGARPYESLMPLPELLGNVLGRSAAGKQVQREYREMLEKLGPEFEILREVPLEDIRAKAGVRIAEGIARLRAGKVKKLPGYDGAYGTIQVFLPGEEQDTAGQLDFFALLGAGNAETGEGAEEKKAEPAPERPQGPGERLEDTEAKAEPGERLEGTEAKAELGKRLEEAKECLGAPLPDSDAAREALAGLNQEQRRAASSCAKRLMVTAGPGTGKTRTLIARIRYLLEAGQARPEQITAVTFTNQAAAELKERLPQEARGVQAGTFHGICLRLLREAGRGFAVAGEEQAREAAEQAALSCGLDIPAGRLLEEISLAKAQGKPIEDPERQKVLEVYQGLLAGQGLLDFDDLLLEAERLLEEDGQARASAGERFRYLLVDEFQDINPLQYRLVRQWHGLGQELFVIGDADQSIYGFRGADAGCFARLRQDYPDMCQVGLTENYRSSRRIVAAAREVISRNPGERPGLHANGPEGSPVRMASAQTPVGEAIFIAKEISRMTGGLDMLDAQTLSGKKERGLRSFGDIAVLYRTHRQARLVEKCLRQEGIPYLVAGREEFLREKAVRDSLAFFAYLEKPEDESRRRRCLRQWQQADTGAVGEEILRTMEARFREAYQTDTPERFIRRWMEETGIGKAGAGRDGQGAEAEEAMEKLARMSIFYDTMPALLDAVLLGVESDLRRCGQKTYSGEAVTLMTLHGSKGLEFPVTFLYGVEAGTIPPKGDRYPVDKEEERRLLYVGMTRAREELILTCAGEESELVFGVPDNLLEREEAFRRREAEGHQISLSELFGISPGSEEKGIKRE